MLNGYKLIAVCLTKIQDEVTYEFIDALYQAVKGSDYRLLLFNSFSDLYHQNVYDEGAKSIYQLLNYDLVDAVIIKADTLNDQQVIRDLIARAKERQIPVILLNMKAEGCYSIVPSYENVLSQLIEHVIKVHHKRKLYFLSGSMGESNSMLREKIFRETLRDCGIDPQTAKVAYGEYWYGPAERAVENWIQSGDLPEAIICANDAMAVAACKVLKRHQIRVPEDMIVTGFDGVPSYQFHRPALSTCTRTSSVLAGKCREMLTNILEKNKPPYRDIEEYVLTIQESCGCRKQSHPDYQLCADRLSVSLWDTRVHEEFILSQVERVVETIDMGIIGNKLNSFILPDSMVALNSDFLAATRSNVKPDPGRPFAEEMIVISSLDSNLDRHRYALYKSAEIYPHLEEAVREDAMFLFQSIYVENNVCGYYIVKSKELLTDASKIHRVSKAMNLAFSLIISRMKQEHMSHSLEEMQYHDPVTGVLNLKGLVKRINELYPIWKERAIAVSVYNIPKYQFIYENYGLKDVEETVQLAADALRMANPQDTVTARISDDSFCIINEAEDQRAAGLIINDSVRTFYRFIESFNKTQDKEYFVEVNCGCTTAAAGWNNDMKTYIKVAMGELYLNRLKQGGGKALKERKTAKDTYQLFETLLSENLFYYVFQPIVSAKTGEIYGYEALMRTPPEIGLRPDEILDIAEEYGRLYEVEYATFNNVLTYASEHLALFKDKYIFINSIPGYFIKGEDKKQLVKQYSDLLSQCTIEITERDETTAEEIRRIMNLTDQGEPCRFAVDDYGTGYSNIVNLLRYKPNVIKIDRYLITEIQDDVNKQMFVKNTVEFAEQNNIQCLAEGVETKEELETVISYGVDLIQGYYTAMPSEQVIQKIDPKIVKEILEANQIKSDEGGNKSDD